MKYKPSVPEAHFLYSPEKYLVAKNDTLEENVKAVHFNVV